MLKQIYEGNGDDQGGHQGLRTILPTIMNLEYLKEIMEGRLQDQ